jgi:septal ring factor EnvC (AmiA/AmiB activator)
MESIVKSDIFFFVTTICVFVVTALLVMILANVLHITKSAREILDKVKGEAEGITSDIAAFRAALRENQFGLKPLMDALKKKKTETEKIVRAKARKVKKAVTEIAKDIKDGINN